MINFIRGIWCRICDYQKQQAIDTCRSNILNKELSNSVPIIDLEPELKQTNNSIIIEPTNDDFIMIENDVCETVISEIVISEPIISEIIISEPIIEPIIETIIETISETVIETVISETTTNEVVRKGKNKKKNKKK